MATVLLSPLASSPNPAGATSLGSAQAQAAQLQSEISAEQGRIDALSQAYDAAQIKVSGLDAQVSSAKASLAQMSGVVTQKSTQLRSQAITSWVNQGSGNSTMQALLEGNASQLMVRQQFIDSIGANEQDTVDALNIAERAEHAKQSELKSAQSAAVAALNAVSADRQGAIKETAAYQSTLSQVHGQIAILVAQIQAQQAAQRQAAAQAAAARQQAAAQQAAAQQAAAQQAAAQQQAASNAAGSGGSASANSTSASNSNSNSSSSSSSITGSGSATGNSGSGSGSATGNSGTATGNSGSGATSPLMSGGSGAPPPSGSGAAAAVAAAERQIGTPYVWGGSSPGGFDCSGLTMYAWAQAGVSLPHYTVSQLDATTQVPLADAQPGDLVFYDTPGEPSPGHVAMYIGGGQVVSANNTGTFVQNQSMYYDGTIMAVGRVS